jgi:cyanophycin synthetase
LGVLTDHVCGDKELTRRTLAPAGIPFPVSRCFSDPVELASEPLWGQGACWVCKPTRGTEGHGVGLGIRSHADLVAHHARFSDRYDHFLLEAQLAGDDVRIQAVGGGIAAAVVRRPAHVVGDGVATVAELAAVRDAEVRRLNPQNRLPIDAASLALLEGQGLEPGSVPPDGVEVRLQELANMSLGATAVDVTDALHPRWGAWIGRVAERLDLGIFALDAMSVDVAADPEQHAVVLEVNARAQWLHHTFSEGRRHDMGAIILRELLGLTPSA